MVRERKPMEDLNAQAKQAVEETKEQALGAADTYFDFLNKTVASFPSGGTDFGEKLKSYAESEGLSRRASHTDRVMHAQMQLLRSRQRVSPRHL